MLDGGGGSSGVHGNGRSSPSHLTPTSPGAGGMGLLDGSDLSSYDLTNAPGNGSSGGIKEENVGPEGGVVRANKGMILRKSVERTRFLTNPHFFSKKISPTTSNSSRRT